MGCCLGQWALRVITEVSAYKLSVDTICNHMLTVPPSWLNNLSSLQSLLWSILSQGQELQELLLLLQLIAFKIPTHWGVVSYTFEYKRAVGDSLFPVCNERTVVWNGDVFPLK